MRKRLLFYLTLSFFIFAEEKIPYLYKSPMYTTISGSSASYPTDFLMNPALLSQNIGYGIRFATGFAFNEISLGSHFYFPTNYGKFGFGVRRLTNKSNSYYDFPLLFSRGFEKKYYLGISVIPGFGNIAGQTYFTGDGTLSFLRKFPHWKIGNHFGLFSPEFGLLLRGTLWQAKQPSFFTRYYEFAPGLGFSLWKYGLHKLRWWASFPLTENSFVFRTTLSYESKPFAFFTGYYHAKENVLSGPSFGLFTNLFAFGTNWSLRITYLPKILKRKEHFALFSFGAQWGNRDTSPPKVTITVPKSFSPNTDGKQDLARFEIQIEDDSSIAAWSLILYNQKGEAIKHFGQDPRVINRQMSFWDIFPALTKRKVFRNVPKVILWDGTRDPIDESTLLPPGGTEQTKSALVPDGHYRWTFRIADIHGNMATPISGSIMVDTVPPKIEIRPQTNILSKKDTLTVFTEKSCFDKNDKVNFSVFYHNSAKEQIEIWKKEFLCDEVKDKFTISMASLPYEGQYFLKATAHDTAGNVWYSPLQTFQVFLDREVIRLLFDRTSISPNKDKIADAAIIKIITQSKTPLQKWKVVLDRGNESLPEQPSEKRLFFSKSHLKVWEGDSLPEPLEFTGLPAKTFPQGYYSFYVMGQFSSGYTDYAGPYSLFIDTDPPQASVSHFTSDFTPDGDRQNDVQVFSLSAKDISGILEAKLEIYEQVYFDNFEEVDPSEYLPETLQKQKKLFKVFSMLNMPEQIIWNGLSDSGMLVHSKSIYFYRLIVTDTLGNTTKTAWKKFNTGFLWKKDKNGFHCWLSSILFEPRKDKLTPNGRIVLRQLANFLQSSEASIYKIFIQVHTDSTGNDEQNLSLSEKRAFALNNYLLEEGIAQARISYQGLGEIHPLASNLTPYGRYLNRRIEIFLRK
ncbi:MAG: OmpA family protein [Candidatus Hydrogenedentota bacterium]|nr:MAG: OmpA family protein [Candidatus Hydrogenedentota bacterium]